MLYAPSNPNSPPKPFRAFKPFTCRRTRSAKRWAVVTMLAMVLTTNGAPLVVQPVHAQGQSAGDAGAVGFVLDAGDLRFIFHQIEIARDHAAGGVLLGPGPNQVPEPRVPFGLRTVDGSFNHLLPGTTLFGASDVTFPRLAVDPADGIGGMFRPAEQNTSYTQKRGNVIDSQPRTISNLIADQTSTNPAAVAVAGPDAVPDEAGNLFIPNVAPDVGLSAPFNIMFTFFGQFFDHGLDLVNKGGAGTVIVPLQSDDKLFVPGSTTNFMTLTRATNLPGPNGISGDNPATAADESADDIQEHTNQTTPFVDQNQTYTSHPAHQVFLREYVNNALGRPEPTGRMIDGGGLIGAAPVRNIGNWGEVKAQARTLLGIQFTDQDVLNVPQVEVDPYGHFRPGPARGLPQFRTATGLVEADRTANGGLGTLVPGNVLRTGHAFLDDIAHAANPRGPAGPLTPDGDNIVNETPPVAGQYDDELLAAHFCTGDGRGNENIALTAVHTVFHLEHNRLRDNIDAMISGAVNPATGRNAAGLTQAEINGWRTTHVPSGWAYGENLFQAARFVTEMQYQHLVFEEFARKLVPSINVFIGDGINFVPTINPAITAEFAHQVYRLGHSMLPEVITRTNQDGSFNDIRLLDGFLNPLAFNDGGTAGTLTAAQAAGAVFQGGVRTVANEIDEFVVEAVRNNLLGLPLDLPVLNLARGRDTGVPPLNEVRRQLFAATSDTQLTPYTSWMDFSFNIKHQESLVNFIAAYGVHPTLNGLTSMASKRAAAELLLSDANFLFADGSTTGVERIDLWMGGLAEKINPFGSLLGTTMNAVFEIQLESLQNADRFYYLERLDGLNLLSQMEGNSFSELISRNTTMRGSSADVFARPDLVFNLSAILAVPGVISDDPSTPDVDESDFAQSELTLLPNGTVRYLGAGHVIWNGRDVADRIFSSEGDDTIRLAGGNDIAEGGAGNDNHIGGDGDDILTDTFGEDVMKGGRGNDAISGGSGPFDLLQGNEGNDFIVGGNDESEVFGGPGNDIIYMGKGLSESIGGGGDDWMEGTESPASIAIGDDNNQFQDDPNAGHDILIAGLGDTDFDSEGGDDIQVGTVLPTHRFEGMLGYDWATYRGEVRPVDADMLITGAIAVNAPLNELRDRFDLTEGLSGTNFNDLLRGDNRALADLVNDGLTGVTNGHVLLPAGIDRIANLRPLVTGLLDVDSNNDGIMDAFGGGNIILGGTGSDLLEGRGGNDIIDGDRWLNVQLQAGTAAPVNSLQQLKTGVFNGTIPVTSIRMLRSIVTPTVPAADCAAAVPANCDTAVFTGPRANYTITVGAGGVITVADTVGNDGVDTVRNVERLQFADLIVPTAGGVVGTPVPNVTGLTVAAATTAIQQAGLRVGTTTTQNSNTINPGLVISTDPLAGIGVVAGGTVNLFVSLGPVIPDIHDHTVVNGQPAGFPAAQDELALSGLRLGTISRVNDPEVPAGLVITQNPLPSDQGGTINVGGSVNVVVSLGPAAPGIVPVVAGLPQADGEGLITDAGFALGTALFANSATVPAGSIISTNPAGGLARPAGTVVTVTVSLGTQGLVAAFGFNENGNSDADDSSVVGRNGVLRGPVRVPGKTGNALSFDGVNDWVTITDTTNSALDLTTGMTIEAWVKPGSLMNDWNTIVLKERGTGNLSYGLYAHDGAPQPFGFNSPAGYTRTNPVSSTTDMGVRTNTPLAVNVWTHLATTYDGANMRLYVNGVLVATQPQTGGMAVGNGALRIGGNNVFVGGEFFHGLIDDVRIYNRALSAAQIQADMNSPIQ